MKTKYLLLLFTGLIISMVINSCKKENQVTIQSLFTGGTWQLASVLVTHYVGSQQVSFDTLNTKCNLTQFFTFNSDNTCTYTNFDCLQQSPASAKWSLSADQVTLFANVVCKDTTAVRSSMPFANAQINNLGNFSLVLTTGDIAPTFSLTAKRRTVQWGFVRVKSQ